MPRIKMIVWVGANPNMTTQTRLRAIGPSLMIFSDLDSCILHIISFVETSDSVLFIVSGSPGESLAHVLDNLPQVYTAYVYCFNTSKHVEWAKQYDKIGLDRVFSREDDLLARITMDLRDAVSTNTYSSRIVFNEQENVTGISLFSGGEPNKTTRDLTEEKVAFVWFQVITEILVQMPQLPTAKEEILEAWRQACDTQHDETHLINEFRQNYTPEEAFRWYTRDTYLYKSLNQALRFENIDRIYKFRFFIVDLHRQLTREFQSFVYAKEIFTVYRGQRMTKDEMEKLRHNLHGLVSMNRFFSTTVNEQVTRNFLTAKTLGQQQTTVAVLWKMVLRSDIARQSQKPFADIQKFSAFSNEAEILLSMGTVFRIDKIEQHSPDFYCFDLTMCTGNIDRQHQELYEHAKEQVISKEKINYSTYGKFLACMSYFDSSIVYYRQVLSQVPNRLKLDEVALATIHNDFAYAYRDSGRYEEAVKHYQFALNLRLKQGATQEENLAATYSDFGWLLVNMNDMSKALGFHQRALDIRERILDHNHADTAMSYNCLGLVDVYTGDFDRAFICLDEALTIRQRCLPAQHPFTAMSYSSLGSYYEALNNRSQALEMHKQALIIYKNSVPPTHRILGDSYRSVGELYSDQGQWQAAIEHLTACLSIQRKRKTDSLVDTLHHLGQAYTRHGDYQRAITAYEEALTLAKKEGQNKLVGQIKENIKICKNQI
ncbi:unnamed protein product [Adineta steineri]|uniref:ADP ribosyltransferase domain-containing protein n=1 Tax=Adineta steineri TaxID=433720 RepID=A0A815LTW3_9BILA|nr:unnamed protein product [Adineta steineri]CAF3981059.1 unnamed protein product [Adineta steineri]